MRSSRWWDPLAASLLLAGLLTAAGRLVATEWVDHLSLIQTLAVLGGMAGLALGQSRFPPGLAVVFALLYGLFAVPWRLGLTLAVADDALWGDRLIIMVGRLGNALGQLARREPVQDPLLFLSGSAGLSWALSVHAGYTLTRYGRPWRVILPPGVALLLIHNSDPYVPRRVWYLVAYVIVSLFLLARLTYLRLRRQWQKRGAHVPPVIAVDFSYVVLIAVVLLVLLAWTVPTMAKALPAAREVWQRTTRPVGDRFEDLFASLRRRGAAVTGADYYGDSFLLGRGRRLTDELVLTVQGPSTGGPGVRYYWRARVYDHYADGRWSSAAFTSTSVIAPGYVGSGFADLKGRRTMTFTFTVPEPVVTLYAAPQPQWISHRVDVDLAENPDGTVDLAAMHATPPLPAGQAYQVRSSLSSVTIEQLRQAGTDYPEWVTGRYLQVPSTITPRTRELAEIISSDQDTPYDVAAAVTHYLRTYIKYTETITPTMSDQEPLDWFLFDLREGFCNYYASAEVVLLRSLGIPARLAAGFAQGDRKPGTGVFVVHQEDAHAWPEVYFPGVGWVEFEPTVSQNPIDRPLGETDVGDEGQAGAASRTDAEERWRERLEMLEFLEEPYPREEPPARSRLDQRTSLPYGILLFVGLILAILVWRARRRRAIPPIPVLLERGVSRLGWKPPAILQRWARRATLSPLERAYLEINGALARLGAPPGPADTPAERAAALSRVLPAAARPARRLLAEYHTTVYGPSFGNLHVAQRAARAIRTLSWRARLRRPFGRK